MPRTQTLFALASVALLIAGLSMPFLAPTQGITVTHSRPAPGQSYAVMYSPRVPCYGVAALFAVFAFLYSLWIPFSSALVQWHFWLTFGSVALAAVGFLVFAIVAEKNLVSGPFGPFGIAVTLFFFASIPIFLAAQLWFVIDFIRALLKMRNA
jgi:hypothetical protein